MHLTHFIPTYPQPGGVAAVIQSLLTAAREAGSDDTVLSYDVGTFRDFPATRSRKLTALLFEAWGFPVPGDPVRGELRAQPPRSAVITHGVMTPGCSRTASLVRRDRPDMVRVAFPHDPYDAGLFGSRRLLKQAYWYLIEKHYLRRAELVVCVAPSHVGLLRDRGVETPTVVLALGVGKEDVPLALAVPPPSPETMRERPPRLLVLGRWDVYEKGLDLFCAALAQVDPGASVRFVGPPSGGRPELEALIRQHGLRAAEAVGFVDDIWAELAWSDALCMPSRKEGFGLAALQAMAAGRPVLLSESAGLAEHRPDAGGVVTVKPTTGSVADGLGRLIGGLGSEGQYTLAALRERDEVLERFSWSATLRSLTRAISEIDTLKQRSDPAKGRHPSRRLRRP